MKRLMVMVGCVGLACSSSWQEPPVVATSRYVEYAAEQALCPVNLDRLDDFIEAVYADLGESPPAGLLLRYDYVPERVNELCGEAARGCTCAEGACDLPLKRDFATVIAGEILLYHEVAHAVHYEVFGRSPSPWVNEGFAERYRSNDGELSFDGTLDAPLDVEVLEEEDFSYGAALAMTNSIIDRHGMSSYKQFLFTGAHSGDDPDSILRDITGESLQATADATYDQPICDLQLALCNGRPLPWDGDEWRIEAVASCDEPGLLVSGPAGGPWASPDRRHLEHRHALEVVQPRMHWVDLPSWVELAFVPCDRPCGIERYGSWVGPGQTQGQVMLEAGAYEVVVRYESGEEDELAQIVLR